MNIEHHNGDAPADPVRTEQEILASELVIVDYSKQPRTVSSFWTLKRDALMT